MLGRGPLFSDDEADADRLASAGRPAHRADADLLRGRDTAEVEDYLESFFKHADADELITVHHAPTAAARLRSVELLAS